MKKVLIGFFSLILFGQVIIAQPVSDNAVIPMAITVQSIMRLTIKSGGNMEFVFNKIADLTNGIQNSAAYDTRFDIAASQNWDLNIGTDNPDFTGEVSATTIPVNIISLYVEDDAPATRIADGLTTTTYGAATVLPAASVFLLRSAGTGNAGIASDNQFIIHWACGYPPSPTMLSTGAQADRYTVNVFLNLVAAP